MRSSFSDPALPPPLLPNGSSPTTREPHPNLLKYYALGAAAFVPLFPVVFVPLYFRYHTLRYVFDREGVTMRWGILFRREISLTYSRIQDIHLVSNFVERWLGLARIQVQTASGSSSAEMVIEGLTDFEEIRDFLYSRMRGAGGKEGGHAPIPTGGAATAGGGAGELTEAIREIRGAAAEIRTLREAIERKGGA
jgi:putative membrane protein